MKILFLTDNFFPERNAVASRVYERARYWAKWGHEVIVITSAPNFPEGKLFAGYKNKWHQEEVLDGVRVIRVKTYMAANKGVARRLLDFLSFMISSFVAGVFVSKPDVVVATSPQFFTAVSGCFLAMCKKKPFVFELGDLWPASVTAVGAMRDNVVLRWVEALELFMYRRAARVVALTQSFKDNLVRRGIDAGKIDVVVNGVELSQYSPRPKDLELLKTLSLEEKFVVGYLGTHGLSHALENVLSAAEILERQNKNIQFIFIGSGAAKEGLVKLAQELKLTSVTFIDPQPKSEISRYWSICDVALVHLKDTELFQTVIPSKMFEAMGMGLPILLAAPQGEASQIIEATKAGTWVKPEQPEALAHQILEWKDNPLELRRLAEQSYCAASLYTRELQADKMLKSLHSAYARLA